eukprot:TRINITY_DN8767_c0_g1_i1.p1 TRINITY_DN8767_c0_g1~~TRINITY_DN8767_c0_g1_i1.p1  ORF type:complete len:329 (-),score=34.23 TRINITY_DN8767_c0_g1_i1:328-1314(-)
MGFFSFVNIMWLGAIVGIAVSVGPVVWLLSAPLRGLFQKLLVRVKDALIWLAENVLLPLCARLHEWGVWEALAHVASFVLVTQAARMQTGPSTYVALSGLGLCAAAWKYSFSLHSASKLREVVPLEYGLVAALCIPHAIMHQSGLIGYGAVAAVLGCLGFSAAAYPFCYCVGFASEAAMERTCVCTALGLVAFQALSIAGVNRAWLLPFSSAVSVLGGIGHYLALLITSNAYYYPGHSRSRGGRDSVYAKANFLMLGSLLASQAYGHIYGVKSLANTSTTFAVLWVLDKVRELKGLNAWFLVFGGSVITYYAALWLHAHPDFVVAMFQ